MAFEDLILLIGGLEGVFPAIKIILIALILIIASHFVVLLIKKNLLGRAKTKSQISSIKIFSRLVGLTIAWAIIIFSFLSYFKSWAGIGVVAGLLTAAIGFALQKPITGVAAWVMVAIKHPFRVGDRISIGNVKGDVYDVSLSHVYLDEVGGTVESEQHSGRNIMIPNYKLFDEILINHTLIHDFVLDEVVFTVNKDSDLDKAIALGERAAKEISGELSKKMNKEPSVRVSIADNGIKIKVLFFAPVQKLSKIKSEIYKSIYDSIKKEKTVNLAYKKDS